VIGVPMILELYGMAIPRAFSTALTELVA